MAAKGMGMDGGEGDAGGQQNGGNMMGKMGMLAMMYMMGKMKENSGGDPTSSGTAGSGTADSSAAGAGKGCGAMAMMGAQDQGATSSHSPVVVPGKASGVKGSMGMMGTQDAMGGNGGKMGMMGKGNAALIGKGGMGKAGLDGGMGGKGQMGMMSKGNAGMAGKGATGKMGKGGMSLDDWWDPSWDSLLWDDWSGWDDWSDWTSWLGDDWSGWGDDWGDWWGGGTGSQPSGMAASGAGGLSMAGSAAAGNALAGMGMAGMGMAGLGAAGMGMAGMGMAGGGKAEPKGKAKGKGRAYNPPEKVFVGGLPTNVATETVRNYFEQFGGVRTVDLKLDDNGNCKGYGFVFFRDAKMAEKVCELKGQTIEGKAIDCRRPMNCDGPTDNSVRKIFVGGLPETATTETLEAYFSQFGQVASVQLKYDTEGLPRGFAFVTFMHSDKAMEVCKMDNHVFHGKPLICKPPFADGAAPGQDKMFVGGLPTTTTKESIEVYFSKFGTVTAVDLKYDPIGRFLGYCFVTYQNRESQEAVFKSGPHMIEGTVIDCRPNALRGMGDGPLQLPQTQRIQSPAPPPTAGLGAAAGVAPVPAGAGVGAGAGAEASAAAAAAAFAAMGMGTGAAATGQGELDGSEVLKQYYEYLSYYNMLQQQGGAPGVAGSADPAAATRASNRSAPY
mmetsp:Transcript_107936/g.240891  ORF Transcript_107936/g.240891 Transcript_107936/m.240891 type:complete len:669 (+) Transcript_107936:160-2166(+)